MTTGRQVMAEEMETMRQMIVLLGNDAVTMMPNARKIEKQGFSTRRRADWQSRIDMRLLQFEVLAASIEDEVALLLRAIITRCMRGALPDDTEETARRLCLTLARRSSSSSLRPTKAGRRRSGEVREPAIGIVMAETEKKWEGVVQQLYQEQKEHGVEQRSIHCLTGSNAPNVLTAKLHHGIQFAARTHLTRSELV